MTKKDLIEKIAEALAGAGKPHITKTQVEAVIDALGDVAAAELLGGGEVPLPGLGKLKTEARQATHRRNPKTGATIAVPAHRVAKLYPGKDLKESLR